MDKEWISKDRDSLDYEIGVEKFLIYAEQNCKNPKKIPCPCSKCVNFKKFSVKIIRGHLYENGFSLGYIDWIWHGANTVGSVTLPLDEEEQNAASFKAAFEIASEAAEVCEAAYHNPGGNLGSDDYDKDSHEFKRFVADAQQPLFEGSDCTKLDSMLKLHNWKARFGISDSSFSDLLSIVGSFLPENHVLPVNAYEAKKTLSNLGLEYIKIHACPNECILYRGANETASKCPKCRLSRWKLGKDGKDDALVPVPIVGEIETVHQAIGSHLAWPSDMIIFTPTNKVEKMKKVPGEVRRVNALFNSVKPKNDVPPRFRVLYKYATTVMKESGDSIQIPCDVEVFGIERTIFLLHDSILSLLKFEMIGQCAISTYMAYMYSVLRDTPERDLSGLFAFLHPSTYKLNDDFNAYVVQRLKDGVLRMNLMPYNYDTHWILIVIWESEIYILDPLPHHPHPEALDMALMRAVRSYNAQEGRVNKNPKITNLAGCPKQPGGTECGYVVMRYIKDIIEDEEMKLLSKWSSKTRRTYKREELDVVRWETLDYIQAIM